MATIQGVYVALFGRPADPTGLAYFNSITNNGADLAQIGVLSGQKEYTDRFKDKSAAEIVTSIYQSLFNRNPEQAGLSFFVGELAAGRLSINNVAIAILDGAQGDDKTTVANKIAAADAFTKAIDTPNEIAAYSGTEAAAKGAAFLTPVTKETSSIPNATAVDAAVANVVSGAPIGGEEGRFFTLTTGADIFAPNAADPLNVTTTGDDVFRAGAKNTLGTADVINGGEGKDTLTAAFETLGASASVKPLIKDVEVVNLSSGAAAANAFVTTVDFGDSSGYNEIWNRAGTASNTDATLVVNNSLAVANVAKTAVVGLEGALAAATFNIGFASVSGTNDSASIALKDASGAGATAKVQVDSIENLTVNLSGTNAVDLDIGNTKVLKFTGDGSYAGNAGADLQDFKALTTIDASASKAAITLVLNAGATNVNNDGALKYIGSQGKDIVTLSAQADTIVYNSTNVSKAGGNVDVFTGFVTGTDKVDLSAFALTGSKSAIFNTNNAATNDVADFFKDGGTTYAVVHDGAGKIYVDINNDGNFNAASDLVVTVGTTAIADIIF